MVETCPPLAPLGLAYGLAMRVRNWLYDHGTFTAHRVGVPVVSVGNLSVGGTGKTPLVIWLVERARAAGKRPGVLARGYGREDGRELNDEGMLLRARFPDLVQVQDPDRVRGAARLIASGKVDYAILDDGFQHRRIARDRDLVCIDARHGGADGRVLPWGRLREPLRGLRRADAVVLTRAGDLSVEVRGRLAARVRELAEKDLPVFESEHAPSTLLEMPSGRVRKVEALRGRDVVLLAAIARPEAFANTLVALGARVVEQIARRDHHRHTRAELVAAAAKAKELGAWLLTTEKDEAKLAGWPEERHVLRVELRFLGDTPGQDLLLLR